MSGYCLEGDRCVCGGDTAGVRAGCAQWREVTSGPKGQSALDCIRELEAEVTRLSAERDRLEKEAEALRSAVSVGLDDKALARAERAESERDALKADLSREREAYAVTAAVAERAKAELSALKARVAELAGFVDRVGRDYDAPEWAKRRAADLHATLTGEQK